MLDLSSYCVQYIFLIIEQIYRIEILFLHNKRGTTKFVYEHVSRRVICIMKSIIKIQYGWTQHSIHIKVLTTMLVKHLQTVQDNQRS